MCRGASGYAVDATLDGIRIPGPIRKHWMAHRVAPRPPACMPRSTAGMSAIVPNSSPGECQWDVRGGRAVPSRRAPSPAARSPGGWPGALNTRQAQPPPSPEGCRLSIAPHMKTTCAMSQYWCPRPTHSHRGAPGRAWLRAAPPVWRFLRRESCVAGPAARFDAACARTLAFTAGHLPQPLRR